ncbi:imidazole glycerol phosphate synthase subunit HisH [Mitsuokella sp. AF21-1AC]|uniref:imidazole glycerol phosphate synthase subunit HisH n=1 Tax=Mitsuokella sp. AF21-1AC TaxID=2292235 RepID=UPI000E4E1CA3|nr:imidazole glycerol phosphate synthase subunit HisH [Mitsuokella sp. AF21-1AC]RGS72124.1 imidazole glycerol phosphate synthase subunit HisH [Mitsuokella sp. AF21-1AC]
MIAVIDYGVGNLFSVEKAFAALGADVRVTSDEAVIRAADKIVLPGVGAFGDCMKNLEASGLIPVLLDCVAKGKPLLGICVGLQILFDGSEESPGVRGLGLIPGLVKKIQAPGLKVPHMGWNSLAIREPRQKADLFAGLGEKPYVYFVHSYHAVPEDPAVITSVTEYGEQLTASVAKGNVQATQFHSEKSGDVGLHILKNFIEAEA